MKVLTKRLTLNKNTIDVLCQNSIKNIKGGGKDVGIDLSCGQSVGCGTCTNGTTNTI